MSTTMSKYGASINRPLSEIVGLSTDVKPTDKVEGVPIQNGSIFIEMDTNKKYCFDIESRQWNLVDSGGGGGGSATLIEKTITANGEYNASDDGADGYKKVEVNVSGGSSVFETPVMLSYGNYAGGEYPGAPVSLNNKWIALFLTAPDNDGILNDIVSSRDTDGEHVNQRTLAIADVNKIILSEYGMHHCLTFKAGNDFIGFYTQEGNRITSTGTTIETGTWYNALIEGSSFSGYTITVETNENIGLRYMDEYE